MRWAGQEIGTLDGAALPGLGGIRGLLRTISTPEFAGIRFHEVAARSALNAVPGASRMPFRWTVNPYRGCSHACRYCLAGDTSVLMTDGSQRAIGDLRAGDRIYGTVRRGAYRRYIGTEVLAQWQTVKDAYRVTLADGTELVASGDHRFLTGRGWKHVTGAMCGAQRRPYLTLNDSLLGFGRTLPTPPPTPAYVRGTWPG